jgi:Domain of unknown function (DUF1990)
MERLVNSLGEDQPTYSDIGASLAGLEPEGFHHDRYQILLGRGIGTFQRAANGLKTWKAHTAPGFRVFPQDEEIRSGATVVVTLGIPFLALAAHAGSSASLMSHRDGALPTGLCPAIPRKEKKHLLFRSHRTKPFPSRSWPFLGLAIRSSDSWVPLVEAFRRVAPMATSALSDDT